MNTTEYAELLNRVACLDPLERMRFIADVSSLDEKEDSQPFKKNGKGILELEGLGREIWQDIDAQDYVNQERNSWNG
ncbi:MAG: hypothetical protein LBG61_01000 [Burkholderiales bacterium]|jgi:hypothetical protein|nr:hypothetical protein [Burkholderiales bacterium]